MKWLRARIYGDGTPSGTDVEILDEDGNVLGRLQDVSGVQLAVSAKSQFVRNTTVAIAGCEWKVNTKE